MAAVIWISGQTKEQFDRVSESFDNLLCRLVSNQDSIFVDSSDSEKGDRARVICDRLLIRMLR